MTAIASSSLVHLCPRLRRVEGRGWGASHGDNKEEKEGRWPLHIVIVALPTLLPPSGGDVISPARIVANVLNNTFIGGKEGGGSNGSGRIKLYNNDNDNVGLNAAAVKVVNKVPAGQGYDGQQ